MENLKKRWNITSNYQFWIIILVFAITGSTSAMISKPILEFIGISKENTFLPLYYFLYIVLIFPFYQILLVSFGYLFGQHQFFWNFEKKMLLKMKLKSIVDFFEKK